MAMTYSNDDIYNLVATQMSDALTADESRQLEEWIEASAENRRLYERLVEVWNSMPDVSQLAVYDRDKAFAVFLERIGMVQNTTSSLECACHGGNGQHAVASTLRRRIVSALRYAAVVAVFAGAMSYVFYTLGQQKVERAFAQITVEAPQGSTTKLTLPDGTKVWLNAGSRIAYSQGFGVSDRRVNITGEGYFDVHHDESMPFTVISPSLNVQVLGTKFDFRDYPSDPSAMVSLDEGSVAVGVRPANGEDYRYRLAPDQRAVLEKRSGNMSIENRTNGTDRLWTDGTIMLNGRRLADIALDLQRSYGVRIVVVNRTLANMRFYGVFHRKDQSLEQILGTLAATGRMRYSVTGNMVRIYN